MSPLEQAQDWWLQVVRRGGFEHFQDLVSGIESDQQISIEVKAETFDGKPVPDSIGMVLLMRAALVALAFSVTVDEQCQDSSS